jgi:hypothetical protein
VIRGVLVDGIDGERKEEKDQTIRASREKAAVAFVGRASAEKQASPLRSSIKPRDVGLTHLVSESGHHILLKYIQVARLVVLVYYRAKCF